MSADARPAHFAQFRTTVLLIPFGLRVSLTRFSLSCLFAARPSSVHSDSNLTSPSLLSHSSLSLSLSLAHLLFQTLSPAPASPPDACSIGPVADLSSTNPQTHTYTFTYTHTLHTHSSHTPHHTHTAQAAAPLRLPRSRSRQGSFTRFKLDQLLYSKKHSRATRV